MPTPKNMFDECTNLIPFLNNNQGNRTMTGAKMPTQAIALKYREAPLVQTQSHLGPTFEKVFAERFIHRTPVDGVIHEIKKDKLGNPTTIIINDGKNKVDIPMYNHFPLNDKKTFITSTPLVKVGDTVKKGELIGDTNFSDKGALALGTNLRTAYTPHFGNTFEDACVISESASKKLASEHLHRLSLDIDKDKDHIGLQKFQAYIASAGKKIGKENYNHLGEEGIVKVGTKVKPGDVLIAGVRKNELTGQLAMVGSKIKGAIHPFKDNSLIWDSDYEGEVQKVIKKPNDKGYTVYVKTLEPMQIGDKLCFDKETEILTKQGWKKIETVTLDDYVATLKDGEYIEYNQPKELIKYPEGGKMYKLENKQLDIFVTDNHKMYISEDKENWKLEMAKDIEGKKRYFKKAANWIGKSPEYFIFSSMQVKNGGRHKNAMRAVPELKIPIKSYLTLLGAFLSEGNIYNDKKAGNYAIEICQTKEPNRTEFIEELKKLNIKFVTNKQKIRIYSKQLMEYFKQFGHSQNKFIPKEVFDYSKEDLEILYKWMCWGDGSKKGDEYICYSSISKQLVDDFQILCFFLGKASNVKLEKPERMEWVVKKMCLCKPLYRVLISNTEVIVPSNCAKKEDEIIKNYKNSVYCIDLGGKVIVMRRNGKCVWVSQSDRHGAKQIVSTILPDHQMPRIGNEKGEHVELLLNPISVAGRINIGQLLETAASKIAKKTGKPYVVDNLARRRLMASTSSRVKPTFSS
jgi:biotin carboxyl carrier protein